MKKITYKELNDEQKQKVQAIVMSIVARKIDEEIQNKINIELEKMNGNQ